MSWHSSSSGTAPPFSIDTCNQVTQLQLSTLIDNHHDGNSISLCFRTDLCKLLAHLFPRQRTPSQEWGCVADPLLPGTAAEHLLDSCCEAFPAFREDRMASHRFFHSSKHCRFLCCLGEHAQGVCGEVRVELSSEANQPMHSMDMTSLSNLIN